MNRYWLTLYLCQICFYLIWFRVCICIHTLNQIRQSRSDKDKKLTISQTGTCKNMHNSAVQYKKKNSFATYDRILWTSFYRSCLDTKNVILFKLLKLISLMHMHNFTNAHPWNCNGLVIKLCRYGCILHSFGKKFCFLDDNRSIYRSNRKGPRIEPWGTPQFIGALTDL